MGFEFKQLSDLQNSDESVFGQPSLQVEFETRSEEDDELVHKTYHFEYAPEWEEWRFSEYEEKKCALSDRIDERNWRNTKHRMWGDPTKAHVDVPKEVIDQLDEMLEQDVVRLKE